MNFITKEEFKKKNLISQFSVVEGNLVLSEGCEYKSEFEVGDIVAYKNDTKKLGIISFTEEDESNICWSDGSESSEAPSELVVVPPTIGLSLLKDSCIIDLWEKLSNGKSDNFDLKCIYLNDLVINEVPFIKAFKNTSTLIDNKFKRNFTLYRKFGPTQIFRTNLYTICDGNVELDTSRYVYYLLENHVVYYLGIDLNNQDLAVYLFNR